MSGRKEKACQVKESKISRSKLEMKSCLVARPLKTDKSQSKFEEETGVVTKVRGPGIEVQTSKGLVEKRKNQIEKYYTSREVNPHSMEKERETPSLRRSSRVREAPKMFADFEI